MQPISNSETQTFQNCQRRWGFEHLLGYQKPGTSDAIQTGIDIHHHLETFYMSGTESKPDDDSLEDIMLTNYYNWIRQEGVDDWFKVVDVEGVITANIGGYEFRGIYDLLVIDQYGDLYFIDHKTVADFSMETYSRVNPQIRLYHVLSYLSDGGPTVKGSYLNLLKKSKQTSRATPPFYKRHFIEYNQKLVDKDIKRIAKIGERIESARGKGFDGLDPSPGYNCRFCPFKEVCVETDLGNESIDELLQFSYISKDPNERYNK